MRVNFKMTVIAFAVLCCTNLGQGQQKYLKNQEINFIDSSWTEALKKATAEHKYIFVDAYAVWCVPCKQLKETTFKNSKVADYFNANFVNLMINVEKGQGIELASKWGLESYPTLYILDDQGNLIASAEGIINAPDLIKFAQKVLNKEHTEINAN